MKSIHILRNLSDFVSTALHDFGWFTRTNVKMLFNILFSLFIELFIKQIRAQLENHKNVPFEHVQFKLERQHTFFCKIYISVIIFDFVLLNTYFYMDYLYFPRCVVTHSGGNTNSPYWISLFVVIWII